MESQTIAILCAAAAGVIFLYIIFNWNEDDFTDDNFGM
jgi:hypothetical protein